MKNLKKTGSSVIGLSMLFLSLCMSNCKDETPKANVIKDTSKVVNDCKSCVEIVTPKGIMDTSAIGKPVAIHREVSKGKFTIVKDEVFINTQDWHLKDSEGEKFLIQCDFPEYLLKDKALITLDGIEYSLYIDPTAKWLITKSICVSKIY